MSSTCATACAAPCETPCVTDTTPSVPTVDTATPVTPATPVTVFDSLASLMSLFSLVPCTNAGCKTCVSKSALCTLESAFHRVRAVDINSSASISVIQRYEAEIARQKKFVEQDKLDRAAAVEALLVEVAKFNAEHPDDQLDVTLDASVMYEQYLFLQKKFAFRASSAPVASVASTTTASTATASTATASEYDC